MYSQILCKLQPNDDVYKSSVEEDWEKASKWCSVSMICTVIENGYYRWEGAFELV